MMKLCYRCDKYYPEQKVYILPKKRKMPGRNEEKEEILYSCIYCRAILVTKIYENSWNSSSSPKMTSRSYFAKE